MSISTTASPPRAATRRPTSTACSTACACASTDAANDSAVPGVTGNPAISSGRTPISTALTSRPPRLTSASASRRTASLLPERDGPAMTTREPLPNGVSHSIALTVGSSEPSATRSDGQATGRSSKRVPSATSSAGRPLMVSTRISDGKRSERRAARTGPVTLSPETSSQRLTCAAEM